MIFLTSSDSAYLYEKAGDENVQSRNANIRIMSNTVSNKL